MRSQYGISLYSNEFRAMKWKEFKALISGLDGDSPLGRIVQIRSETDPKMLESFSQGQHEIRNKWQRRLAKEKTPEQLNAVLHELQVAFMELAK